MPVLSRKKGQGFKGWPQGKQKSEKGAREARGIPMFSYIRKAEIQKRINIGNVGAHRDLYANTKLT